MNVYPRKPLEAERGSLGWWFDAQRDSEPFTDAEFAEHFYPAELLDALLAAVERLAESRDESEALIIAGDVCAAFRALREQVTA